MKRTLLRPTLTWLFGLIVGLTPLIDAHAVSAQEQLQIHANRATSSLLQLRGEGFQPAHKQRLEADLAALQKVMQNIGSGQEELARTHLELVTQLRNGVAYGPNEEDVPWRYPEDLSRSLRDFLSAARALPGSGGDELGAKIEYLGVQYLARSYMGNFEIAREQPDTYVGQDERVLLPNIDNAIANLQANDPQAIKLKTRWTYLRSALSDMNSAVTSLVSTSGRPFAPLTVDRHTRAFTSQWMAMN